MPLQRWVPVTQKGRPKAAPGDAQCSKSSSWAQQWLKGRSSRDGVTRPLAGMWTFPRKDSGAGTGRKKTTAGRKEKPGGVKWCDTLSCCGQGEESRPVVRQDPVGHDELRRLFLTWNEAPGPNFKQRTNLGFRKCSSSIGDDKREAALEVESS